VNSSSSHSAVTARDAFVTTRWTQVLDARGPSAEARAALSDLCAIYYAPVFGFIRRSSPGEDAARDLTQEFFARLLKGCGIDGVDPERGRFRSFLLGAVKHFLADVGDRARAAKRGSGNAAVSIQLESDTSAELQLADGNTPGPEREFDRKWVFTVLDRALAALAQEHKAAGKVEQFDVLKSWLTGDNENLSQAEAAAQLGMSEGAIKVAIHRLRRRFRELVKAEIGQTLNDPTHIADELACLLAVLSGG